MKILPCPRLPLVGQTVKNPPAMQAGQDVCSPILAALDPAPRGGRVLGAGALRGHPPGVGAMSSRGGCDVQAWLRWPLSRLDVNTGYQVGTECCVVRP